MLLRAKGRHDGVKEYLEKGRKLGRDLERDELDERVILAGDLELTNSIIQSIDVAPNVDRYLSVTMSFKEDSVSRETLEAITEISESLLASRICPKSSISTRKRTFQRLRVTSMMPASWSNVSRTFIS